ncbi:hypothetical protein [Oceanispirochaeta sp.]|jgi:epoxyqueuosine reductase QueG|uniref:hypothetical protein n=1 Tax=Oceanispirochaeta sp. TaxID=2035350 RepID=UPI002615DF80|nr:hypothetical protein [Oceanispirochaeta sp.]MDA3955278.1 hypothetical protein [Oceanispirochaeta sp.]
MDYALEKQIEGIVRDTAKRQDSEGQMWREALTSYALIDDRPFHMLKSWVREDHLMPTDLLPNAESVICFFIPFTREITCSNEEGVPASRTWGEAFVKTNLLIDEISDEITMMLETGGFNCARLPATESFDTDSLTSRWSHRHVAYISGLGTFGKNNMLITKAGCSGRLGSIITDAPLTSSPLPEEEYCIEKEGNICGQCVSRCARGALTSENYDRHSCYNQCLDNGKNLGTADLMDVCGKCLTRLPCTFRAPV